jgi:Phasin protein
MESKGRRAPRAAGPVEARAEPHKKVEAPAAAVEPTEVSVESHEPAEIMADAAKPLETGAILGAGAGATFEPQPDVRTPVVVESATVVCPAYFGREGFSALAQSQAALARGLEALSAEMAGLVLSGIDAATRTATKMLGVKTLSDAIEVNTGLTCSSFDVLVGGSAKLSELGLRLATNTSRPILTQLGKGWIKASGS